MKHGSISARSHIQLLEECIDNMSRSQSQPACTLGLTAYTKTDELWLGSSGILVAELLRWFQSTKLQFNCHNVNEHGMANI